ncbi:hypothetical protein, partial [Ensifer sp. NM-2]|uniref:hypothetical protein n=1 Tax=Ensifer sp. NM-2 TaxID=2109730 RepID=UPI001AEC8660
RGRVGRCQVCKTQDKKTAAPLRGIAEKDKAAAKTNRKSSLNKRSAKPKRKGRLQAAFLLR